MNLDLYHSFYFVAKYGSISKASEHLYITQPAVSRTIKQLEEALGCKLFLRTSKGVKLTQEGDILYHYIQQAFSFISSAEKKINDIKNLISGEIRIGVSDTLCKNYLIKYLKLFNTLHPEIKIHVTCPTTPVIIDILKAGKIDFGIINMPYNDDMLSSQEIAQVQDCFVTGEKFKHLCNKTQHLKDLVNYPLILLEKSSNSRSYIDQYFKNNLIDVTPAFELGNIDLLIHFAKYDFGIACVIKDFIQDELDKGDLYEVKVIEKIPARNIGVAWVKDVPLSTAAQELISLLGYSHTTEF